MKTRGTTCNTEERHSAMIAKGDLGQELSRRRTKTQRRGKQERMEEQRNEAMPKPCTAHTLITAHYPWLLLPTLTRNAPALEAAWSVPCLDRVCLWGTKKHMERTFHSSARVLQWQWWNPSTPCFGTCIAAAPVRNSSKGALLKVSSSINSFFQNFSFPANSWELLCFNGNACQWHKTL